MCELDKTTLSNSNTIDKCYVTYYNKTGKSIPLMKSNDYVLLQIPYTSKGDLHKLHNLSLIDTVDIMEKCIPLYHLDIKLNNILIAEDGYPRFIDFGLSRTAYDFMSDKNYINDSNYYIWPYEFRFLKFIDAMIAKPMNMMDVNNIFNYAKYNYNYDMMDTWGGRGYSIMEDGPLFLPSGVLFKNGMSVVNHIFYKILFVEMADKIYNNKNIAIKSYLSKVDVYSLGLAIAQLFVNNTGLVKKYNPDTGNIGIMKTISPYSIDNAIPVIDKNIVDMATSFYNIIENMINPNPDDRYTITAAKKAYEEFIKSYRNKFAAPAPLTSPTPVPASSERIDYATQAFTSNLVQLVPLNNSKNPNAKNNSQVNMAQGERMVGQLLNNNNNA